ncbi:MAG: peptidylprolyl isomerase [Calditrichaeota bacterium]|nr:MAG: peptidylprolyl isomerase [Calditrichota bacterium]
MGQAKTGDTVKVHYTGKLVDGTIFDSSENRAPLEFTIGDGQLIPGFEQAVIGMQPGETVTVTIAADDAYGQYNPVLVQEIGRDMLPEDLEPQVGQQLEATQGDGGRLIVTITEVSDDTITIDANHPLAGKDLVFDIQLVEIV